MASKPGRIGRNDKQGDCRTNECTIRRITDYSTSLHIYEGDVAQARRVGQMVYH